MLRILSTMIVSAAMAFGPAHAMDSTLGDLSVTPVLSGLYEPWGFGFLPDGAILVTERDGRLTYASGQGTWRVGGVPKVVALGQGGLLDVLITRDFARSRMIMMSYSKRQKGRAVSALATARLSDDGKRLTNLTTIFEMISPSASGHHFGSRLVEAKDGTIFMTIGERGDRELAQDVTNHNGTVIRIRRDGSAPEDNPFVGQNDALPEIWSYGHRNPQGAALDLNGQLWVNEHGAQGGDEVNRVLPGHNYGWPVIAYGRHYSGAKIGEGTQKEGMDQPAHYWDPSIAPSGMMVYSGKLWPQWRGDFFVGSLKFDYISRLDPDRDWHEEKLQSNETGRVRDIREGPDGAIWFLSVDNGTLYRIAPGN